MQINISLLFEKRLTFVPYPHFHTDTLMIGSNIWHQNRIKYHLFTINKKPNPPFNFLTLPQKLFMVFVNCLQIMLLIHSCTFLRRLFLQETKESGGLFLLFLIYYKLSVRVKKVMTAAPSVMLAATHLMFVKDQRGGLRCPQGTPHTPILKCLEMIFRTLGTKVKIITFFLILPSK